MKRIVEDAVRPAVERIDRAMAQLRWTQIVLAVVSVAVVVLYVQFFSLSERTTGLERRVEKLE